MREYINLVESMMLNEFTIMKVGDVPRDILNLNVITDTLGMDSENVIGDLSPAFVKKYKKLATSMARRIKALPQIPLSPTMVNAIDFVYHVDPSTHGAPEYYEPGSEKELAKIYDKQLEMCNRVVTELEQMQANPEKQKHELITSILKMIKQPNGVGHPLSDRDALAMIAALRNVGLDYPEFDAIEKSLKSGLDEETIKQAMKRGLMKGVKAGLVGTAVALGMGSNYHPSKKDPNASTHFKTDATPAKSTVYKSSK